MATNATEESLDHAREYPPFLERPQLLAHRLTAMMLAGLPVPAEAVQELAYHVRVAGADELANRLKLALEHDVKLLALTLDERALMLSALEDPPDDLAELRAVLLADHQWKRSEGID